MAIFSIFRVSNEAAMTAAIQSAFPKDHLSLGRAEWLVSATGTAKDVSDRLGISDASNGVAIVFSMANYFGRAPTDVWDWIKAKAETAGG